MSQETEDLARIGRTLRVVRLGLGLSVEQLAKASGLSAGLISQVERGKGNPAFSTLHRLAHSLGLPIAALLAEPDQEEPVVVPHGAGVPLPPLAAQGDPPGFVRTLLTPRSSHGLQLIRTVLPVGYTNADRPFRHLGFEAVHVLSGRLLLTLDQEEHEVGAGDTATYECTTPHYWANGADHETVVLGAVVPMGGLNQR